MGRLFWKIFAAFWITLLLTVLGVTTALTIQTEARRNSEKALAEGPRSDYVVNIAWLMAQHGGMTAVRSLLSNWGLERGSPPLMVDQHNNDLIGRPVPNDALTEARHRLSINPSARNARYFNDAGGNVYTIFLPSSTKNGDDRPHWLPPPRVETPFVLALAAILASLGVSALLARHFSRPIRKLQSAFQAASHGQLDVRVSQYMGKRRDEIGDLGREFDGMATHLQLLVGSQNRLLHDVSHELRSPLARLQVAVGLARQNPSQIDSALSRIERETERLDALVGEVLTLSRLEAQSSMREEDYVDIVELIASIIDDARFETEGSGRHISFDSTLTEEIVLRGRAELLHRAFENVVRNAVRHTPPQSTVSIHIGTNPTPYQLQITIADSGQGVPENELASIFDPFFRSAASGSSGYGLGLAIARRAVEAHGGDMQARNRPTGGLEVEIRLPVR